jgi:hypothetical protein
MVNGQGCVPAAPPPETRMVCTRCRRWGALLNPVMSSRFAEWIELNRFVCPIEIIEPFTAST